MENLHEQPRSESALEKMRKHAKGAAFVALLELFGAEGAQAMERAGKAQNLEPAFSQLKSKGKKFDMQDAGVMREMRQLQTNGKRLECIYANGKESQVLLHDGKKHFIDLNADGVVDRLVITDAQGPQLQVLELVMRGSLSGALENAQSHSAMREMTKEPDWKLFEFAERNGESVAYAIDAATGEATKVAGESAKKARGNTTAMFDESLADFTK